MLRNYLDLPRPVHILCLGTFINRAGTLVLPSMTIYLQQDRGLGTQFATLAIGAYGLGACCATLIGGHLADRFGRRIVMLGSLSGGAGMLLLFSTLRAPSAILTVIVLFAMIA